jgi:hypothetical protein
VVIATTLEHPTLDWRLAVVTTLMQDLPATASGAPAHKAGAAVVLVRETRDADNQELSFATPSVVALALDIAKQAGARAQALKGTWSLHPIARPQGPGYAIHHDSDATLFDYFESCMASVTSSFQALEGYCNLIIDRELRGGSFDLEREQREEKTTISLSYRCYRPLASRLKPSARSRSRSVTIIRRRRRKVLQAYTQERIEREVSTAQKLGTILPQLLGVSSPKGTKLWQEFGRLKEIRDKIAHPKARDQFRNYATPGQIDESSLFYEFFHNDMSIYPKAAVAMIYHFERTRDVPRWLIGPLSEYGIH